MSRRALRPRLLRSAFYAATAALVAWAAVVVPLPLVEYEPGNATSITSLIELDGVEVNELDGDTRLLTVIPRQRTTTTALTAALDPERVLLSYEEVFPPEVDREERRLLERERFARQFDVAVAVGARAAGVEVELATEVVVVQVLPGSPADGVLAVGDVVLAVDGDPLGSAEELQAITRTSQVGDTLRLTVRHAGRTRDVEVTLARIDGVDAPRLGVAIQTAVDEARLPFEASLAEGTRIGGPSAGLMIALTMVDLLDEENLLDGRLVVGTGTIDADGRVGPVGGVAEKLREAAAIDADLALVPESQLDQLAPRLPAGLEVVGVGSLDDALAALGGTAPAD
ncbi:MAG: PDZ domain-containing protein [Nitriliruptoraceae bacterium]